MGRWIVTIFRVLVGGLIAHTGVDLARSERMFAYNSGLESFITGVFVLLIGLHIIFSSIFDQIFHNHSSE